MGPILLNISFRRIRHETKENEEDDKTREQKLKHEFFNWKTKFFDEKKLSNEEEDCPSEFYLAEEFLSIVAKGFRDQEIRFLILFAKSGAVKKEEIATYENYAKSGQYDRCWIVANECTSQSKNFMQRIGEDASSVQMRFIPYAKLKSDWTESIYVHKYRVVTKKEQAEKKLKEIDQYPKILFNDSSCIQTLADIGDVLLSTGPSATAGEISQYKLVIPR